MKFLGIVLCVALITFKACSGAPLIDQDESGGASQEEVVQYLEFVFGINPDDFDKEAVATFESYFKVLDLNEDGQITIEEVKELKPKAMDWANETVTKADVDPKDGKVTLKELTDAWEIIFGKPYADVDEPVLAIVKQVWFHVDANNDDQITLKEIQMAIHNFINKLEEPAHVAQDVVKIVKQVLHRFDANTEKSHSITLEEIQMAIHDLINKLFKDKKPHVAVVKAFVRQEWLHVDANKDKEITLEEIQNAIDNFINKLKEDKKPTLKPGKTTMAPGPPHVAQDVVKIVKYVLQRFDARTKNEITLKEIQMAIHDLINRLMKDQKPAEDVVAFVTHEVWLHIDADLDKEITLEEIQNAIDNFINKLKEDKEPTKPTKPTMKPTKPTMAPETTEAKPE